jgi:predicted alpha/beta superfamily hydrolase
VTTLRVHYPAGARTLALRGDGAPLTWSAGVPFSREPGDVFVYRFENPPARIEWKPLLDDTTWSRGPNYVAERGATVDVWPHFERAKGRVEKLFPKFHSNALGNDRAVWAYLPAAYDENTLARYPVLYMHDGQNLFDAALAFGGSEWKVDETLDDAGETTGAIKELIVVAPENTSARIAEYTPSADPGYPGSGKGDLYLKFLVEELKPRVDAMLRTKPGRESTGVMGSSLGGLISAHAGVSRAGTFGVVGAMSPSTWWNGEAIVASVQSASGQAADRVYVDCGQPADGYAQTQHLVSAYLAKGYVEGQSFKHVYQMGAQHNEVYWAARLPAALAFLFGPR